jgi:hypothetical protein
MQTSAKVLLLALMFIPSSLLFGQIGNVEVKVNTIGTAEIYIQADLVFDTTYIVDSPELAARMYSFELKNLNDDTEIAGGGQYEPVRATQRSLLFIVKNLDKDLIDLLVSGKIGYYISVKHPLFVRVYKPDSNLADTLTITPEQLKSCSSSNVKLSEKQMRALIDAAGGEAHLYHNRIDLGKKASITDSTKNAYLVSFIVSQPFLFSGNVFYAKGTLSTDKEDPLTSVLIYPVTCSQFFKMPAFGYPSNVVGQIGLEGSQDFSASRINLNVYSESIIPNIIDLTFGENRLRLKPILKIGAKGLFELKTAAPAGKTNHAEIFSELYYYVPVMKNYCLIVEGNACWLNDGTNRVRNSFSFTMGVEIPGTSLKTMAKYSVGENDVNLSYDSNLVLGLVMDIFEK